MIQNIIVKWWKCHSLSIVLLLLSIISWGIGWWYKSDFMIDIGHDCFSGAIIFVLSGKLRELNKPEE